MSIIAFMSFPRICDDVVAEVLGHWVGLCVTLFELDQ